MTTDPFIQLPTVIGDIYIRRSQIVLIEPETSGDSIVSRVHYRLYDTTLFRTVMLTVDDVIARVDPDQLRSNEAIVVLHDLVEIANLHWTGETR